MKKRIFIAMHYMEIGGAEISLIGLLQALDYSRYDVDLFVYSHQGELMEFIPKKVRLLPEIPVYAHIERPMKEALLHGHLGLVAARLWAKWKFGKYLRRSGKTESAAVYQYIGNSVTPLLPSLYRYGEYDLAISFLMPHNIVLDKVKAKKKACWIHTDYSTVEVNAKLELPVWNNYEHIASISAEARNTFLKVFPSLRGKVVVIENILSPDFVRRRAELMGECDVRKEMPQSPCVVNLVSVGRFCEAKNYDNVPFICRRLLQMGLNVSWYIIGYGNDSLIRKNINDCGMQEHVVLLGKRTNPYPYIKACDVYVQPSRYEGKSVTVREAQMLCKPVVVTNYPTASSQIQDGVDGIIVPLDNEGCARGLADFIRNKELQGRITDYLRSHDYGNESEVQRIEALF